VIKGLLDKNPKTRFGFKAICSTPWVADINWDHFLQKKVIPPWVPKIPKCATVENFVKWDLDLPAPGSCASQVVGYCESLRMPVPKVSALVVDDLDSYPETTTTVKGSNGKGAGGGKSSTEGSSVKVLLSKSSKSASFKGEGKDPPPKQLPRQMSSRQMSSKIKI
jgi:hypothetical protein